MLTICGMCGTMLNGQKVLLIALCKMCKTSLRKAYQRIVTPYNVVNLTMYSIFGVVGCHL